MKSYAQIKAIEAKNKKRILALCPKVDEDSGIYMFTRIENGIKYGYVGQAKHLLTRLAQHLSGYQHIDLSIKKHGLYSEDNPTGYKVTVYWCGECELDEMEREFIKEYANAGYQLRNKTVGGQDEGKAGIAPNKPAKGYYDGLQAGYNKARKEVGHLFRLHLNAVIKSNKPNKTQEKALRKFNDFLNGAE